MIIRPNTDDVLTGGAVRAGTLREEGYAPYEPDGGRACQMLLATSYGAIKLKKRELKIRVDDVAGNTSIWAPALVGGPLNIAQLRKSPPSSMFQRTLRAVRQEFDTEGDGELIHRGGVVQLETCVESAWLQRLKLKCDELLSSFAFTFK